MVLSFSACEIKNSDKTQSKSEYSFTQKETAVYNYFKDKVPDLKVKGGVKESVAVGFEEAFVYLDTQGKDLSLIEKKLQIPKEVSAPVNEGDTAGQAVYVLDGKEIGRCDIVYFQSVDKAGYKDYLKKVWQKMLL